jgi:tetratricopeptide (TPR) repeat protein
MRFAVAALLLLTACGEAPVDLSKLSRPKQIAELRAMAAKSPSADTWKKLGEVAMDEGDALTAIEAYGKAGDAAQVKAAQNWMDPAAFPAMAEGTAPDLFAAATSVPLAIDSTFTVRAIVISKLNRAGRLFLDAGDRNAAGQCVTRAVPQVAAILKTVRPSLYAFHLAADHDDLYGDMLFGNRHWGEARDFYQKNVIRFKNWDPPTDYTRKRLAQAQEKVKACEKKMIP